jgi:uncharacterized OsmC-like protein
MKVSATLTNKYNDHQVSVQTDDTIQVLKISSKSSGYGSSINGAELLLLSLATCFCNDIYREAKLKNINVSEVSVICNAEFGAAGEAGVNFIYKANVISDALPEQMDELIRHTDKVAEIHKTLRQGINISLIT